MIVKLNEKEIGLLRKVLEAAEPFYMEHGLNNIDKARLAKGKPPIWAKKVTNIKPRAKHLPGSSSHTETAMRRVTQPFDQYMESDWRTVKKADEKSLAAIAERLRPLLPAETEEVSNDNNEICVRINGLVFRITVVGSRYHVFRFNPASLFDRDSELCGSLQAVADYISDKKKNEYASFNEEYMMKESLLGSAYARYRNKVISKLKNSFDIVLGSDILHRVESIIRDFFRDNWDAFECAKVIRDDLNRINYISMNRRFTKELEEI